MTREDHALLILQGYKKCSWCFGTGKFISALHIEDCHVCSLGYPGYCLPEDMVYREVSFKTLEKRYAEKGYEITNPIPKTPRRK